MRYVTLLVLLCSCVHVKDTVRASSVDVGVQLTPDAAYPYTGVTLPTRYVNMSLGAWVGADGSVGPYMSFGHSWQPFAGR